MSPAKKRRRKKRRKKKKKKDQADGQGSSNLLQYPPPSPPPAQYVTVMWGRGQRNKENKTNREIQKRMTSKKEKDWKTSRGECQQRNRFKSKENKVNSPGANKYY